MIRAAKIGVENACLLNTNTGVLQGKSGSVLIDEKLLEKILFIKEGQFVENGGKPTLRVIGDIQTIETGKVIAGPTRKVVRAIEQTDVIESFLKQEQVESPLSYVKRVCSATAGNLPIYYYLSLSGTPITEGIQVVKATTARGTAKQTLIKRLETNEAIKPLVLPLRKTEVAKIKERYITKWINENIEENLANSNLRYCIDAITYIEPQIVKSHANYLFSKLLFLYKENYENANSSLAASMRNAICYLDEILYKVSTIQY